MHEAKLIEIIKKAALDAVEAQYPVRVLFGVVETASPLVVRVDQKLLLSGDMLVVAWGARECEQVQSGLQEGDCVILLRMQGGQKYVLLDKKGGAS